MSTSLVTGGSGFLGLWLTRELCRRGHRVRLLLRRPEERTDFSDLDVEAVRGDVTDPENLMRGVSGCDVVFHLAGVVGYSRAQRQLMEKVNVEGTRNVVSACLAGKVQRLVHVSSVAAIGASRTPERVLNEDSPFELHPLNLGYFETKLAGELVVREAVRTQGLDAVIVNPSTIYGGGDAKKGSRKMQLKVARGQFKVYTSGGVSVIAVEDAVQGLFGALERGRRGERYILSGENLTIQKLFEIIATEAGVAPPAWHLPNIIVRGIGLLGDQLERLGKKGSLNSENANTSLLYHWFDHSKASRELGFSPRPARDAIRASIDWSRRAGLL